MRGLAILLALLWGGTMNLTHATDPLPLDPIPGTLYLHGGTGMEASFLKLFVESPGQPVARVLVLTPADRGADEAPASWPADHGLEFQNWAVTDQTFPGPVLSKSLVVWIDVPALPRVKLWRKAFQAVLKRGGAVGWAGPGVELLDDDPDGIGVLPHATFRHASKPGDGPEAGQVGYELGDATSMIIRGRRIRVGGQSPARVHQPASTTRPARTHEVEPGAWIDMIAEHRASIARAAAPFPPAEPPVPHVPSGSLVIVGGGVTDEIVERFLELAGGKEEARVVFIPTAVGPLSARRVGRRGPLKRAGAKHVTVVHTPDRRGASDESVLGPLREATGIWFGGGRQWRLVDSYGGTEAEKLMHQVLARGGVIGGSSAGATIQADYLVRGNPLGNQDMMAEGYERGFGFIQGVAIDQHFSQRQRQPDMVRLKQRFPQLLGLGIDEQTAVVVQGHRMEVIGNHRVTVYDGRETQEKPDCTILEAGQRYDLRTRKLLETF